MSTLSDLRSGNNLIYPNEEGTSIVSTVNGLSGALTIAAGTGISVATASPNITITNSSPASGATIASAGGTETLVVDGTGPAFSLKGLTAGTGISLSSDASSITVTNSSPASSVVINTGGSGQSLVFDGTGPTCQLRSLVAGSGVSITAPDAETLQLSVSSSSRAYLAAVSGAAVAVSIGSPAVTTVRSGSAYISNDMSIQATGDQIRNDSGRTILVMVHWHAYYDLNSATTGGLVQVKLRKNGTAISGPVDGGIESNTVPSSMDTSWIVSLDDTDYIDVEWQAPSAAVDVHSTCISVHEI